MTQPPEEGQTQRLDESTPAKVSDLAQADLDFAFMLMHLAERDPDDRLWGAMVRKHYQPQIGRRLYARTFFSFVESILASLKEEALLRGSQSPAEKLLLAEQQCDLDDSGKARTRRYQVPVPASLRFTFQAIASAWRVDYSPDYSGAGWKAFQESVRLRNRLTHPKQIADLDVSDTDLETLDEAHDWFIGAVRQLLTAHIELLNLRVRGTTDQLSTASNSATPADQKTPFSGR